MSRSISIIAHANCDDTYVVWRYPKAIPECRGFALYRKPKGGEEEPVHTFIPFAGKESEPGEHRPSSEWPIQKFAWADVLARSGETVSYRVVPMVGEAGSLKEDTEQASPWSDPVAVTADCGDGFSAYFNRGVLATQSVARRLKGDEPWGKKTEDDDRDAGEHHPRISLRRIATGAAPCSRRREVESGGGDLRGALRARRSRAGCRPLRTRSTRM